MKRLFELMMLSEYYDIPIGVFFVVMQLFDQDCNRKGRWMS